MAKKAATDANAVFSSNVAKVIERAGSQTKLQKHVPQTTLSRLKRAVNSNPRLSTIQQLALGLGLEAWQLLVPDFDPSRPPTLVGGPVLAKYESDVLANLDALPPQMRVAFVTSIAATAEETRKTDRKEPA
jgi:hypothetical protein